MKTYITQRRAMRRGGALSTALYFVERIGADTYQSVFPEADAELSQTHSSVADALDYIRECAGTDVQIEVRP
jgi:hypothetical protein